MRSIASKFNLLTIFLITLTALITLGYIIWQHQSNALTEFSQHGEEIATILSKEIAYGVKTNNQELISQSVESLEDYKDIAYIQVFDKQGVALLQQNLLGLVKLPAISTNFREITLTYTNEYLQSNDKSFINIITPVYDRAGFQKLGSHSNATSINSDKNPEVIGYLQLGLGKNSIYGKSKQFLLQTLAIIPATLFLGILLTLWQTRRITQPIKKLVSASQSIARGEFGNETTVFANNDEIAELAHSFNKMSLDLALYQKQVSAHQNILQQQVEQRTLDLQRKTDEAVELAQKATASSKAKGEFLATMSHEIRTPMNGVLGMTELLLHSGLESRQQQLAESAFRSAKSLLGIINNILDFSKIESGKFQLIPKEIELRRLLTETAEMLATQIERENLELILNLPHNLNGKVYVDEERLRQVLVNLLGNALKFTDQGQIELKVSLLTGGMGQKDRLFFEVSDTGTGISAEQQNYIFDSFTQVDSSTTRTHGGTGLGLAISSQIVELMGGELKVKSRLGQGSCFYFNLDLDYKEVDKPDEDLDTLKNQTVLIVDDNATNRNMISNQLSAWGMRCRTEENGELALKSLMESSRANNPFTCILLDCQMPGMDGLTTALAIKTEPRIPPLSVILMGTANTMIDAEHYPQYGIAQFLNKPVIQKKLRYALLNVFDPGNKQPSFRLESADNNGIPTLHGKVLLAEDNLINQEVAKGILKVIGCEVEIAHNGFEAVEMASKGEYDLILMDCHMPGMDGFVATTKIREWEEAENRYRIPILALTADVQKGVIAKCNATGMDGYLSKPYTCNELQEILSKWLLENQAAIDNSNPILKASAPTQGSRPKSDNIDQSALDNLRYLITPSGESLLEMAIDLFFDSAPKEITLLKQAYTNNDAVAVANIAHNFKSSSGNLGLVNLAKLAASLEYLGRQSKLEDASGIIQAIADELPGALTALEKELNLQSGTNPLVAGEEKPDLLFDGKRVLLIDDDSNFRFITASALNSAGFHVDEVSSGHEALLSIKKQLPDLVLLDAIMPDLDGFDTCRLLKQDPTLTDIPIIMVTGMDDVNSINNAFEAGASDFIPKPVNYPILIQRVNFGLRNGQVTAELRNSKLQLSAAQRIARLGYWTWDTQRDQFTISDQLAQLGNINLSEFDGSLAGFIKLVHPKDRDFVKDVINAAAHSNTIQHIEYRINPKPSVVIEVQQEIEALTNKSQLYITGIVQDISHKKNTEKQIHRLAYFDHLTGLANRSYYQERMDEIIKSSMQRKAQFAFMFIDMDDFKDINDSFGHHIGDQFLQEIAQRLKLVAREIDFIVRLGGDEFCIILNNIIDESIVAEIAKRCLQKINQPLMLNNHQIKPKASIGISLYPKDGTTEAELLKTADTAMYLAKQSGKQRYIFYSSHMASQVQQRLEKENMLREASAMEQFILYYQPQVSMVTGKIVGVEALVRWLHPEKGIISPIDFINLAERLGIISQLGHWSLKTVCEQIAEWHHAGLPYIQVGVNISPAYLQDPALLDSIKELLEKTQIPPHCLQLEITENGLQAVSKIEIFNQLRGLGIKIAINDFGSGFSSLASLKQLPLDGIKIDRMFIEDLLSNPHTPLLLGTIIGLANALNFTLVAEGVETKDQASVMLELGCQIMQGFLFSHPVSGNDIPALMSVNFSLDSNNKAGKETLTPYPEPTDLPG